MSSLENDKIIYDLYVKEFSEIKGKINWKKFNQFYITKFLNKNTIKPNFTREICRKLYLFFLIFVEDQ